jgi:hypothetical protein
MDGSANDTRDTEDNDTIALPPDPEDDDRTKTMIIGIVVAVLVVIVVVVALVTYRVVSQKRLRQSAIQNPVIAPGLDADDSSVASSGTGVYGKLPHLEHTTDPRTQGYDLATLATDVDYGEVPRESATAQVMTLKSEPPVYDSVRVSVSNYDMATSPMHA